MTPSIPLPTDNLHKFICLLGLAFVLSGVLAFYGLYTTTLDKKLALYEQVSELKANKARTDVENQRLEMREKTYELTLKNEKSFNQFINLLIGIGVALIMAGYYRWNKHTQVIDDQIKRLQLRKLELELEEVEQRRNDREWAKTDMEITPTASGRID